ncbi:MAG: TraB/GumN family protein [Gammaproteobacteria bacterium]|jgi:uncharacterized protein|nr:TraB/GumN family protein [Gammaproteobacteria bacterium]
MLFKPGNSASQLFTFLLLVLFCASQSSAQSSVWLASKGDNKVYLGGTIHMLRADDYPLPSEYEIAYSASDNLYFEIDIDSMNDPAGQLGMLQRLMYTDGRTLQTVLNNEAYETLTAYVEKFGMPMLMLQNMKPGMLMSTLELLEFQSRGFTPDGVDVHFHERAKIDGKTINAFETLDVQIGFVEAMGEGEESEYVLLSLKDLEKIDSDIESMVSIWRNGRSSDLVDLFVDEMEENTPGVYQSLLVDRNNKWMPTIEAMFNDADTELVLVGVAHLVGEDGLVELLRNRGYQVEQI